MLGNLSCITNFFVGTASQPAPSPIDHQPQQLSSSLIASSSASASSTSQSQYIHPPKVEPAAQVVATSSAQSTTTSYIPLQQQVRRFFNCILFWAGLAYCVVRSNQQTLNQGWRHFLSIVVQEANYAAMRRALMQCQLKKAFKGPWRRP